MMEAWAAWERIAAASAAAEFRLVGDYEGLWACTLGWTNEAEARRGSSINCSTAAEAIRLAISRALEGQ